MLSKTNLLWVVIVVLLASCAQKKECHNTQRNPILASNLYTSKAYQAELYRLIKESSDVDYYYEMREEILGQVYLVVSAYGDAFCGKLCLIISEEDASRITIDARKGYQGAQLIGLRYKKKETTYAFSGLVYDSMEYVVD